MSVQDRRFEVTDAGSGRPASTLRRLVRRWPSVAALAFAALVAADLARGVDLAPVLVASAVVYLGSAAFGRRAAAWPLFFLTVVVITVAKLLGLGDAAVGAVVGLAALLLVVAAARGRAFRPGRRQVLAFAAFAGAAALALWLRPDLGAFLVAAGLLGHAGWDVVHHRTGRVVVRSMAEFCAVLDVALALAIGAVTLAT